MIQSILTVVSIACGSLQIDARPLSLWMFAGTAVVALGICTFRGVMDAKRFRRFALAATGFGLSMATTLAAAEFLVRALFQDISTTNDNSSYFARKWNASNPPRMNSLGYRERELKTPSESYRIAVVGDSFTYGQGLKELDRMTNQLEELLTAYGDFQVLNFGVPGSNTSDHVTILSDVVLGIKPEFILLQWFQNDVENEDESIGARATSAMLPSSLRRFLHQRSALYFLANLQWVALGEKWDLIPRRIDYLDDRFSDPDSTAWRRAERELTTFISLARASGAAVGIIAFPYLIGSIDSTDDYPLPYLVDRLLRVCREHAIDCIDLRPTFLRMPSSELWVNRFDSHPSKLANCLAARSVVRTYARAFGIDQPSRTLDPLPCATATE